MVPAVFEEDLTVRASNNPAFTRSPAFTGRGLGTVDALEEAYSGPSATSRDTGRMTVDDVVNRTGLLLAIAFATGALTWAVEDLRVLTFPAAIEGLFLGGISQLFDARYHGIVVQAVICTAAVTGGVLALYKSGRIKVTPQFTKMVVGATIGFFALIMVNLVVSLFTGGPGVRGGTLGIVVGLFAIGLASMNLILDFDMVEKGARQGLPTKFGWFAAFGIMVTLVWLYIEILRLLAILRGND